MTITTVIPARLGSRRLANKMLALINGRPLVLLMLEKAIKSKTDLAYILTDSPDIASVVPDDHLIYDPRHAHSGTHRIANALQSSLVPGDTIINLQGDEPLFELDNLNIFIDFANYYKQDRCSAVKRRATSNIGVGVWVENGWAVDFQRNNDWSFQHIGIYSYPKEFLMGFKQEEAIDLEQTAFLPLRVIELMSLSIGVDTYGDLQRVRSKLKG